MSKEAAERHDDKVRRDFLDEMIFTGVVQQPLSYDEVKATTDRLDARIRQTERRATVERIREAGIIRHRVYRDGRHYDSCAGCLLDAEAAR